MLHNKYTVVIEGVQCIVRNCVWSNRGPGKIDLESIVTVQGDEQVAELQVYKQMQLRIVIL